MNRIATPRLNVVTEERLRPRRPWTSDLIAGLRRRCFNTGVNSAITLVALATMLCGVVLLLRFAVLDAVFTADSPAACRAARGACWATVYQHARVMFFGLYPRGEQWRAEFALACVVAAAAGAAWFGAGRPKRLLLVIAFGWGGFVLLMRGGLGGLTPVTVEHWGGLPLTIHVFLCSVALGFPLAIALAIGRASRLPAVRFTTFLLVELVRSVPLLTILFCAAVVAPLMVPAIFSPAKIGRVILGLALFYACLQSEVIRGGMRAVRPVEIEGAAALGLTRWQTMVLVILPQAIRFTIPATVNLLVVAFKDTSLIVVVGLFDFLAAANTSIASDAWAPFFGDVYAVVAATYLVITGGLSWFGRIAERRLAIIR